LYIQICEGEEKYRSIFENAIEGIIQQSPEGRIISANPALAQILGYDSAEDLMEKVTNYVNEVYADPDRAVEFKRIMETEGGCRNFEYQVRRKDGSLIWVSVNGRAVRDSKGVLRHYEGMIEDVTAKKLSESREILAKTILETLNRQNNVQKLIEDILHLLKEHTGVEATPIFPTSFQPKRRCRGIYQCASCISDR
jgi:PAS domain S-box-containing protein